ncbi:hypothetical protein KDW_43620 [Dictyobacter vulcani]|uniref:Uncharacterized protein n=1 Tax=Dictyobacter vulcani TaxID=2607529 RepID=A0A5J4KUM9_9CHLR|nr:hypothetical protein KDW_43620 [Dictyobacter vulcani]
MPRRHMINAIKGRSRQKQLPWSSSASYENFTSREKWLAGGTVERTVVIRRASRMGNVLWVVMMEWKLPGSQ